MLNKFSYSFLKTFQEYWNLSIDDLKTISKNKISIFDIGPHVFQFYKDGYLKKSDIDKTVINTAIPVTLKLCLSTLGINAIIEYEEEEKKLISSKNFSKISLLISFISLIISVIALFKNWN